MVDGGFCFSGCFVAYPRRRRAPKDADVLFARRVLPLLKQKCFSCHGDDAEDLRGGLDMRSLAGLLAGGESGEPSLAVGEPENSPIYLAAARVGELYSPMPPKDNDALTVEQVESLRTWIAGGAPWAGRRPHRRISRPSRRRLAERRRGCRRYQRRVVARVDESHIRPCRPMGVPAVAGSRQ